MSMRNLVPGERILSRRAATDHEPTMVPPIVHQVVRSPGQPLDAATRAFFQPRFSHDFSRVRVHTDAQAAESARAVNALAYSVGPDIVFATGQYVPESDAGRRLLAHELTHVLQDPSGRNARAVSLSSLRVADPADASEREAARNGEQLSSLTAFGRADGNDLTLRRNVTPGAQEKSATTSADTPTAPPTASVTAPTCRDACNKPENFYEQSKAYCKDTKHTGKLHLGNQWKNPDGTRHEHVITSCYREVPRRPPRRCPSGLHVCFDAYGHCGDCHEDSVAPFDRDADGKNCIWSRCSLTHFAADVLHIEQGGRIDIAPPSPRDDLF